MSTKAPFQLTIPRRSQACVRCLIPFEAGQEYFSVLSEGEGDDEYLRSDYCLKCWSKKKVAKDALSMWKAVVPQKKEVSDLPKQKDARAMILLKEILISNEPTSYAEAFVLSLYLARRRLIYLRQEVQLQTGLASLYEVAETEEMLCVPKVSLSDLQVEKIQTDLAKKFSA